MSTTGTVRSARAACTILATLATAAVTYRVWRASAFGLAEALAAGGTAALLIGACAAGWTVHVRKLRARAELAEWEAARLRREELLDDDADRELWDSIPAHPLDEDTCAFGLNVVAINQYRQAG